MEFRDRRGPRDSRSGGLLAAGFVSGVGASGEVADKEGESGGGEQFKHDFRTEFGFCLIVGIFY